MAPVCSSRGERTRSVWRARKALAEACDDSGQDSAQMLHSRLHRAVCEIKRQVEEEAPSWIETKKSKQTVRMPIGYFVEFAEHVVRTIHRWSEHEIKERTQDWQTRLEQSTKAYLREADVYNERQAAGAKKSRMLDRQCPEEELYLYEPMQYWDLDRQEIMRAIINLRLGRILPHLAESRESASMQLQAKLLAEEDDEEEDEEDDHNEENERRKAERLRRQRLNEDLKDRQAHDKAMAEIGRLASSLERRKADLLKQLQTMTAAAETAEVECESLQDLQDQLQRDVDMKRDRRNLELESRKKAIPKQDEKESDAQQKLVPRNLNLPSTVKAVAPSIKVASPKAQPVDQAEIMRRVRDIMKAIEADQARERAKLKVKIKELEESIARLKHLDFEVHEELGEQVERTNKNELLEEEKSKDVLVTQLLLCKVKAENRRNTSVVAGEVVIVKEAAPKYKARRIFDKLHDDASDRVTRFVVRKTVAPGNDSSNKFKMDSSNFTMEATSLPKPVSCVFSTAEAQLSQTRRRNAIIGVQTTTGEMATSVANRASMSKPPNVVESVSRPSSAAKIASVGKPMDALGRAKRASSATTRPAPQNRASLQKISRPLEECCVAKCRSEGVLPKALDPTKTQSGASVLYSRVPPELAGPVRTPLLRTAFDQHYQEAATVSSICSYSLSGITHERQAERD